ncbi:MAG: inhibitor of cysteine peptidase [Clostridia bacterium]|nr:inhibitor of cysteine peptidase [Clostridia bacterium]
MKRLLFFLLPALCLALVLLVTSGSVPALTRLLSGAAFGASGAGGSGDGQDRPPELPVVGSYANLKALLEQAQRESPVYGADVMTMKSGMAADTVQEAAPMRAPAAAPGADYSRTNVQVAGVDEADLVKTDGQYIYQVNGRRVVVARAYPAATMQVTSILAFPEGEFTPQELYVDEQYLVVIGSTYRYIPWQTPGPSLKPQSGPAGSAPQIYPPPPRRETTVKAVIYDLGDRAHLKKVREVELEGNYVSSRKIGAALYLVANRYLDYYHIMNEKGEARPAYRDSARESGWVPVDYQHIRYFPDFVDPNYLLVAGLDLDRQQEEMQVATYLGAGQNIYASPENLYVAVTHYRVAEVRPLPQPTPGLQPDTSVSSGAVPPARPFIWPGPAGDTGTTLYKFALEQGRTKYLARGEVPGTILNQFSMDEYQGYFRVATTRGEVWRNDVYTAKNNVYILDAGLQVAGRLEDIAPGERIYSVRFMGGRGYMVTFKKVDPLFVIDLQDAQQPKILGALKIPGYSDYLHPYDENHIIGFGKDTIEMPVKDFQGNEQNTMAFYQGMKMALFDVSDVQHPVEKYKEIIGDRGTDSELLRNHKALLFDREKGLLAFPVTVMEVKNKTAVRPGGPPAYGEFTFQGAYVYNINLEQGFTLRGRITHLDDQDYLRAGQQWYDSPKNVNRILYIDNSLYTLSQAMIKAHDLATLQEQNTLAIPAEER